MNPQEITNTHEMQKQPGAIQSPRLPAHIRKHVNRLAHQLARVEETRFRQRLMDQATAAIGEGAGTDEVLALLKNNSHPATGSG